MRELGLEEAIRAAGGVGALARGLGISQPSVSTWQRDPGRARARRRGADRRLAHGAAARPLPGGRAGRSPADGRRGRPRCARTNTPCSRSLLGRAPTREVLARLAAPPGRREPARPRPHRARARRPPRRPGGGRSASIFDLFIGVGRGELLPYALLLPDRLPATSGRSPGCARTSPRSASSAPRASATPRTTSRILCEIMARLAAGRFERRPGADRALLRAPPRALGGALLRRSRDGEVARGSTGRSARVGRLFMEIETEGFAMDARASASRTTNAAAASGAGAERTQGGAKMQDKQPTGDGPPQLPRAPSAAPRRPPRPPRRALAATEAQAYDPGEEETRGPLPGDRPRQGLLPRRTATRR